MPVCGSFPKPYFSTTPSAHCVLVDPPEPPLPGTVLIGYMIFDEPQTCLVPPCKEHMNFFGMASVILLGFLFWPLMCIPCICGASYDGYQYPVYG